MRGSSSSPNFGVLQQILVNKGFNVFDMSHRRYAPDDKSGTLAHKISIGFSNSFTDQDFDDLLIYPVGSAGNDHDWPGACESLEDDGLCNLTNLTSYSLSSFLRCAG